MRFTIVIVVIIISKLLANCWKNVTKTEIYIKNGL